MKDKTTQYKLVDAIQKSLHNEKVDVDISDELISLSQRHQVQTLLYLATNNVNLRKKYLFAASQSIAQEYAVNEIATTFEEKGIDVMLIKGICTKFRYPNSTMRTMGDIDILVNASQSQKVHKTLLQLEYGGYEQGRKHDNYTKPPYVTLEVHRNLLGGQNEYYSYYSNVWQKAINYKDYKHVYVLPLEDEYIFNIIHLVSHLKNGGIGLRFVVDIYIYEQLNMNREYIEQELKKLKLDKFYKNIKALAIYWFGDSDQQKEIICNEQIQQLGDFILDCGIFGKQSNKGNLIAGNNRWKTFIKFCFPGYNSMKSMFPWLVPVLLPFAWILRMVRALLYRRTNVKYVLDSTVQGNRDEGLALIDFYEKCGLPMEKR